MNEQKNPTLLIAISQVILVVAAYIIVSIIATFIASFIQAIDQVFPVLSLLTANKFQEFVSCTLLPTAITVALCSLISVVYKKYYFHIASTIIIFMLASWLIIQDLFTRISTYGLFSYTVLNQLWFDAILFIPVTLLIFKKTAQFNKDENETSKTE